MKEYSKEDKETLGATVMTWSAISYFVYSPESAGDALISQWLEMPCILRFEDLGIGPSKQTGEDHEIRTP